MLVKTFIFTVLIFAGLAQAVKERWETNLEVSGFGSTFHVNLTGISNPETNGSWFGEPDESTTSPPATTTTYECDEDKLPSQACQNFAERSQNSINDQINEELAASYAYLAMATYFSRDDPHKMGFADFFFKASAEEREHAVKLIEYQNQRGGRVSFTKIAAPSKTTWQTGLEAMEDALSLEKSVNAKLLTLHRSADADPHLQDFLETHYLSEQVDAIRELSGYVSQLKALQTDGLGEFIFDDKLKK